MSFEIIKGGLSPGEEKEKQIKSERLKICLGHIRAIENSISITKSMASQIGWNEFDEHLNDCHNEIKKTLIFVKKTSRSAMTELQGSSKPKTNSLKVAINNTPAKEEE